jgi:O-methyltransferase
MFLFLRRVLSKLLPTSVRYALVRNLPNLESLLASSFRGIDKVWLSEPQFMETYLKNKKRSLLDVRKAYILFLCARKAAGVPGHFGELGVFKGAGSRLMLAASQGQKQILLFDTFEGLPESKTEDGQNWDKGTLGDVSFSDLRTFLGEPNFEFYKGYFPESAAPVPADTRFAFVHIDFDIYQSTCDALNYCYAKMSPGGIMLFDDYGVKGCPGVKQAIDDFFRDKPEMVNPNLNGQAVAVKV